MKSLLQVHFPTYTQTPAPASFLTIPVPSTRCCWRAGPAPGSWRGCKEQSRREMRWEQSAASLNSSPGWAQRQRMRQQWTDFRKYKNCNIKHCIKKGFGCMAWKVSCVVQADRHTLGWDSGQGIKMMVESHWSQLFSSGPACPASTQHAVIAVSDSPVQQMHSWFMASESSWKEKEKKGDATYEVGQIMKLRGRLEKQWHSRSNKKEKKNVPCS